MNIEYLLYLYQCQYCRHLQAISLLPPAEGWNYGDTHHPPAGARFLTTRVKAGRH